MYENVDKLSLNQQRTIELLLMGFSIKEIAEELRVNINTIYRWKNDELFGQVLRTKQNELTKENISRIKGLAFNSIEVLNDIMTNSKKEQSRIRVAIFFIEKFLVMTDETILEKLDEIESLIKESDR